MPSKCPCEAVTSCSSLLHLSIGIIVSRGPVNDCGRDPLRWMFLCVKNKMLSVHKAMYTVSVGRFAKEVSILNEGGTKLVWTSTANDKTCLAVTWEKWKCFEHLSLCNT